MITYNQSHLHKLEDLIRALGYRVRYEKGNFKTGACVLQAENILVINKFSDIEVKIKAMLYLIHEMKHIPIQRLDDKQRKFLFTVQQIKLTL